MPASQALIRISPFRRPRLRLTHAISAAELSHLIEAADKVCDQNGRRPELVVLRGAVQADSRKTPAEALLVDAGNTTNPLKRLVGARGLEPRTR